MRKVFCAFKKSISLEPNHAISYSNLGVTLVQSRRLKEAEKNFMIAIGLDKNHSEAIAGLGDILMQKGNHREGLLNLRIANGSIFFNIKNGMSVK